MRNVFARTNAIYSQHSDALFDDLGQGRFRVAGFLLAKNARALFEKGKRSFAGQTRVEVDLKDIERADSAGLAVLLEWVAWSNAQSITITYRDIPRQVISLATIWEVESLLLSRSEPSAVSIDRIASLPE